MWTLTYMFFTVHWKKTNSLEPMYKIKLSNSKKNYFSVYVETAHNLKDKTFSCAIVPYGLNA